MENLIRGNPWHHEEEPIDEFEFSKIKHGYHAWNIMSPELEFCVLAGATVAELGDEAIIVETGVGQGYVTRRILDNLHENQLFYAYESDPDWLAAIKPHFDSIRPGSPGINVIAEADFLVFDSNSTSRLQEMKDWAEFGLIGSLCLIHDTFHHSQPHGDILRRINSWKFDGEFIPIPRGAWLGVHP